MRKIIFYCILTVLSLNTVISQETKQDSNQIFKLENNNSWAVGAGISNFIMHGDLRSIGTGNLGNFYNFGAYAYLDKMFNPLLGFEVKVSYSKISGGAQYFSNVYEILYIRNTQITNNLFFEGRTYGAELNLILSFSNLYKKSSEKWNVSGYFGIGYHQYDSALYEKLPNGSKNKLVDFGYNPTRNSVNEASSIFLSVQLGVKRRLNKRVDIELRSGMYFNYEDHLDATISNKQDWESFFVTNLGLVVKLGKQNVFSIWGKEEKPVEKFEIIDTDLDGVMDALDLEPNTPKGVQVYGNGVSVDSDGDGIPDYLDKCRFVKGPVKNHGCPIIPVVKKVVNPLKIEKLNYSKSIYFDTNSNSIKTKLYFTMLDKAAEIMLANKDLTFSISGFTDSVGSTAYNLRLSKRRANEARKYLIGKGIESDRISAEGFGELNPKFDNNTEESRQLNRRVEIKSIGYYKVKVKEEVNY